MGVYRDAVEALAPSFYLDCSSTTHSAGYYYAGEEIIGTSSVPRLGGNSPVVSPGAVPNEGGSGFSHVGYAREEWDDFMNQTSHLYVYGDADLSSADTTWVYTWASEDQSTWPEPSEPTQQIHAAAESGTGGGWEIYTESAEANLQLRASGYWSDVLDPETGRYGDSGSHRSYVYDTGIPKMELLDGRPHLIAVFAHGEHQLNSATPISTNTWIRISLDGADRYTSPKGQSWADGSQAESWRRIGRFTELDEVAAWDRHLTSTELASLKAAWGDEPPYSSWAYPFTSASSASSPVEAIRYAGGTSSMTATSSASMDPAWMEELGDGIAEATAGAELGTTSWEGADVWIPARPKRRATRWLEEPGEALKAKVLAQAAVSGSLAAVVTASSSAIGRSSVSGSLAVAQRLQGAAAGQAQVAALLGYTFLVAGQSAGQAQVAGELLVGQVETLEGSSAGGVTFMMASLWVERYSHLSGKQDGDHWGPNENLPPGGAGRDDGPGRRRFTRASSGRVTGALT